MFTGKLDDLTSKVIGAFYKVYNCLGYGFSEKVYENALVLELKQTGLAVESQKPIQVFYEKCLVGEFFADILVNDSVIIEVKAVRHLLPEHEAQLLNYLKATQIEVGLLLNFGAKAEIRRKIFDNEKKGSFGWIRSSENNSKNQSK